MRHSKMVMACAGIGTLGLLSGCREQSVQPPFEEKVPDPLVVVDSTGMWEQAASRDRMLPPGLALVPVASPTLAFLATVDSFEVQLTGRECAAPNNWVVLTSPVFDTLSATMCQETIGQTWPFVGPYPPDSSIAFEFESGAFGGLYDGQMAFSDTLPSSFPEWNLEFEDANDNDFDDFYLRIVAYSDSIPTLEASADTTILHPWVDSMTFATGDTTFVQLPRAGDTATVTIEVQLDTVPASGVGVQLTGWLLPEGGGHSHYEDSLLLGDLPSAQYQVSPAINEPAGGFFLAGSSRSDTITVTTDSAGIATARFVAGFLGGRFGVQASATIGGAELVDTLELAVRVPGLVDVSALTDSAYFTGAVDAHLADSIWFGTDQLADTLRALAQLVSDPGGDGLIGINDISLIWGGSFTIEDNLYFVSTGNEVDRPNVYHYSHAIGVDADLSRHLFDAGGTDIGDVDHREIVDLGEGLGLFVHRYSAGHFHVRLRSALVGEVKQ